MECNKVILFIICFGTQMMDMNFEDTPVIFGPPASVYENTASRVKIKWDFAEEEEDPELAVKDFHVQYRSADKIEKPEMLVSNPSSTYYIAQEAGIYPITPDVGKSGHSAIWAATDSTHMLITVDKLKLGVGNYQFNLSRTLSGPFDTPTPRLTDVTEKTSLEVVRPKVDRTSPNYPVKTGAGCFHVIEHNNQSRKVKIYWQLERQVGEIVVHIYELNSSKNPKNPILVDKQTVLSSQGWIVTLISLRRHYVVIETLDEAGSLTAKFVVQYITPQEDLEDLLVPLSRNISWNENENMTVMTWQKPKKYRVESYTVFWLDGRAPPFHCIIDFVQLPKDTREFKVKGNGYTLLGLSVNAYFGSSGLHSPCGK